MRDTCGFPMMAEIIPESPEPATDGFFIKHKMATPEEAERRKLFGAIQGDWTYRDFEAGTYCVLDEKRNGMVDQWMSDTSMERTTNERALRQARGDVLILGLGIGMLPIACCRKPEVTSVIVVEIEPQVIALVEPHIRHPKLRVLQGDAFYPPFWGRSFDMIYLDIWQNICTDNWEPMKALLRQYRRFARNGAWVSAWLKDYLQEEARLDRQRSYW